MSDSASITEAQHLCEEIVDTIRAETDAPLKNCVTAAFRIMDILTNTSDIPLLFNMKERLSDFRPDLDESIDAANLRTLCLKLEFWFRKKEDLSSQLYDGDSNYVECLDRLADIVEKTYCTIANAVLSKNEYLFIQQLSNLCMNPIGVAAGEALIRILKVLPKAVPIICESMLPIMIVMYITEHMNATYVKLLGILTSSAKLPLGHYSEFNDEFFSQLYKEYEDDNVMKLLVDLFAKTNADVRKLMLNTLCELKNVAFSLHLITFTNKNRDANGFVFLSALLSLPHSHVQNLFYRNDLVAIAAVVSRELRNNEDPAVRFECLRIIESLALLGIIESNMLDAVECCEPDPSLELERVKTLLQTSSAL